MPDERDLSGEWTVRLDPDREGIDAAWFETPIDGQPVELPGALRESGIGDPVGPNTDWIAGIGEDYDAPRYDPYREPGNFKMPYWLQPERHYVGVAWYERTVTVPESWDGRPTELHFERPHWATTVWVDGERVGSQDSLATAHEYDPGALAPGEHRITVRIDNSLVPVDVGENAHSVSDHTQSAWHGIVGDLALRARPRLRIDDARVIGDADARTARVSLSLGNDRGSATAAVVDLTVTDGEGERLASERLETGVPPDGTDLETTLSVEGAPLWDEFDPALCRLEATIEPDAGPGSIDGESEDDGAVADRTTLRFGLRDVDTEGSRVTVNGRPVSLRGTLECCVFPETGYPPTDADHWRELLEACVEHGLNHVRFHSWCPPEAAFEAADELGVYLQVECSAWPNQSTALGEGEPVDDWLYEEADRLLAAYGTHPSLCLLAAGNEPGGNDEAYLREWIPAVRGYDGAEGCLVTGASGWPIVEENAVHVTPEPRIHAWGAGLDDRLNAAPPATTADYRSFVDRHPETPVLAHENGQWCAYPDFGEIDDYTGALRPRNFEIFREFLDDAGLGDRAGEFLAASGALQELCYEEEIESALRTPGMAGFQLLMLHDFPGQGTALVGTLDAHFEPKPYHDVERFREYAGPVVPLARLDRRTFVAGGSLEAELELSQFGPDDLADATVEWSLTAGAAEGEDEGEGTVDGGRIDAGRLPTGALHEVGTIRADLDLDGVDVEAPAELTLAVDVPGGETEAHNSWSVWVVPADVGGDGDGTDADADAGVPAGVTVTDRLDEPARERLRDGERVVLFADPGRVDTDVELGFTPIFWNTAWTGGQSPHTLGLLPDPDHPALAAFPTDAHTDWQWWDAIANGAAMELDDLPGALDPIVGVVPDWFDPERLGLAFEAEVLGGRLLVCASDLGEPERPAARQLRRSLLEYAGSDAFDPDVSVDVGAVRGLFDAGE